MSAQGLSSTMWARGGKGAIGNFFDWQILPTFSIGNYQTNYPASAYSVATGAGIPFPNSVQPAMAGQEEAKEAEPMQEIEEDEDYDSRPPPRSPPPIRRRR